jgi:hypothetical protein
MYLSIRGVYMSLRIAKALSIPIFGLGWLLLIIQDLKSLSDFLKAAFPYFNLTYYLGLILVIIGYYLSIKGDIGLRE